MVRSVSMTKSKFKLNDEIISNARENMYKLIDNLISLKMEDLETFEFPLDEPFGLEIVHGKALFYFIINFSSTNKNLICMPPGAFNRHKRTSSGDLIKPPYFTRWSWYRFFEESVITFADPMIFWDDDIKIGWMLGEKDDWYIETLSIIIQKLAKNQGVLHDNILFFGSSGGGFISVCLATLIKNSKVVINNAQLSVLNYRPKLVNYALDTASVEFDGMDKEKMKEEYSYRLNVIELFEKENYAPDITYYVNVKSKADVCDHSIPFIAEHYNQSQFTRLTVIYYSEEKKVPHHPLPTTPTIHLIKAFAKNNLYNKKPETEKTILKEDKYLMQLKKENKRLKRANSKMKNSRSWKITKPLRKLMNILRRK